MCRCRSSVHRQSYAGALLVFTIVLTFSSIDGHRIQEKTVLTSTSSLINSTTARNVSDTKAITRNRPIIDTARRSQRTNVLAIDEKKKEVPGKAGVDYPTLNSIPSTSFTCTGLAPGYYADEESGCQVFHVCYSSTRTSKESFLCPNGTVFNQRLGICEWWTKVNCNKTPPVTVRGADMVASHSAPREAKAARPRYITKRLEDDRTSPKRNTTKIDRGEVKLLLDNLFSNFTDNKVARGVKTSRGQVTYRHENGDGHSRNVARVSRFNATRSNAYTKSDDNHDASNNEYKINTLLPFNHDRLTMIDKLIHATGEEYDSSRPHRNRSTHGDVEIIPSLSYDNVSGLGKHMQNPEFLTGNRSDNVNALKTLLEDMRVLNAEFVKYKTSSQPVLTGNENKTASNGSSDFAANNNINLNRYGIYYLTNNTDYTSNNHKNNVTAMTNNTNYYSPNAARVNNNIKIRQNTVMTSVPKVSDILTGGLLNINAKYVNPVNVHHKTTTLPRPSVRHANRSVNANAVGDPLKGRVQLKELDVNKVRINTPDKPANSENMNQVEITQRPIYRYNNNNNNNNNYNNVYNSNNQNKGRIKTQNLKIGNNGAFSNNNNNHNVNYNNHHHNHNNVNYNNNNNHNFNYNNNNNHNQIYRNNTVVGSTSLYGIDLLASTTVMNRNPNYNNNNNNNNINNHRIPIQKQPALNMYDIHHINQLQDGTNIQNSFVQMQPTPNGNHRGLPRPPNHRFNNVKPVNENVDPRFVPQPLRTKNRNNDFTQFRAARKHEPVIVLPSLGFSLNSEDDIKAFNHAVSAGLLDEER